MRALDEAVWADVVRATGLDVSASPLRPLDATRGGDAAEAPLVEAAGLALGRAEVLVTVLAGARGRGVVAQLGADPGVMGVAVRAVVAGAGEGSEPVAVPGVQLGACPAARMVGEIVRLVPPEGDVGDAVRHPATIARGDALVIARTAVSDPPVAAAAARRAGLDAVPPVLAALARGTTASVTLTVSTTATPLHAVRQWLLTDEGWVSLTVLGRRVVHTPRTREGLAAETTSLLAGAWDAAIAGRGRAS